jgi:hypothetical protein
MKKLIAISILLFISACAKDTINEANNSSGAVNPPSNLKTAHISSEYIDLSWDDNSTNETEFVIEYRSNSTTWSLAGEVSRNSTEYRVNDLSDGSEYFFRVLAKNENIISDYSDSVKASTLKKLQPFKSKFMFETTDSLEMRLRGEKQGIAVVDRYYEDEKFVIKEYTNVPPLKIEETFITKMHGETYDLLSYEESFTQNSRTTLTTAVWDSLTVSVQSGSKQYQRTLDPGTVERGSFFYSLNAMPLEIGDSHNLKMYHVKKNLIWDVTLIVEVIETVSVPAGDFETYHVVLKGAQPQLHLYIDTESRRLVKMEIPTRGWEYLLVNK